MAGRFDNDERGFTIVEGLVVLVVTGILVTLMFKFHVMQNNEYDFQTQISFLQKGIRSSIEAVEAEIRMAGSGFPKGALASALTIVDGHIQGETTVDECADEITILRAVPGVQCVLTDSMNHPDADLKCDDVSSFNEGWAVIYNEGGAETFLITEVSQQYGHLRHQTMPLSRSYSAGSVILQAQYRHIFLDEESCPDHPRLVSRDWDGEVTVIAENIENIQFTYILKDDTETTVHPANITEIDRVRMEIVGRTARADTYHPEDGYRRRALSAQVQLRNFHLRVGI